MRALGIDVGGSHVKAAVVDTATGTLLTERVRVDTPRPATPEAVVAATAELVAGLAGDGPVGVGFPAVVVGGMTLTAANVDAGWVGAPAASLLTEAVGTPVRVLNDADAAGMAEMRFGAGRDVDGVVLLLTLGTGIGSALFSEGVLVPNTELGHIEMDGREGERYAADSARERKGLTWEKYARRLERYIRAVDALIWPDLVIIGGGVSRKADRVLPHMDVRPQVVPATLQNEAGIVGAAVFAAEHPGS